MVPYIYNVESEIHIYKDPGACAGVWYVMRHLGRPTYVDKVHGLPFPIGNVCGIGAKQGTVPQVDISLHDGAVAIVVVENNELPRIDAGALHLNEIPPIERV